jgi:hypothetical protein
VSVRTLSYRLHNPIDQAVVTIGGRRFDLGRFGTTISRAEYDGVIANWLAIGRRMAATAFSSSAACCSASIASRHHAVRSFLSSHALIPFRTGIEAGRADRASR